MQNIALAWLVLQISHSPLAVGALAFCRFVPFTVFGLVAGWVTDRVETRRLLIWTQAAQMVIAAALATLVLTGAATLPLVLVLAALGGVALVFDAPGRQTLTFQLVGERELPNAVALNSSLFNGSRIVGPALAGIVIAAFGVGACFVLNTVSFLAVLASLLLLRESELYGVARSAPRSLVAGVREGLAYVARTRELMIVLSVVTVLSVAGFNFHVIVPLLASDTLQLGPEAFGLLAAAFGAGALAGALAAAALGRASRRGFLGGTAGFGLSMLALAPLDTAWLCAVLLFAVGVAVHATDGEREHPRPARHAARAPWAGARSLPLCLRRARAGRRPPRRLARRAGRYVVELRVRRRDGADHGRRRSSGLAPSRGHPFGG